MYVPLGKGSRGLVSCEGYIGAEENSLGWYIKRSSELNVLATKIIECCRDRIIERAR